MAEIVAIGGTGMVGSAVVLQLAKDGHKMRVMTRTPDKAISKFGDSVEVVKGDVTSPRDVEAAMRGMDAVFCALSSPPGKKNVNLVEYSGNLSVIEACKLERVKRFIYVSVLNAEYFAGYPRFFVKYRVEEELKISGLNYTAFRPTLFMETIPRMVDKGKAIIYGTQPNPVSFVAVADFANMVSNSVTKMECYGQTYDVLGLEQLTFDDALGMYKRIRRPNLRVTHSSLLWGKLLGYLMRNSRPELAELVSMMNEFERTPEKGDAERTNALLGAPTVRYHDWLLTL
jgi:uncharacterized protein YbjT (DUF2867 family)